MAVPAIPLWLFPAVMAILAGGPGIAVALNVFEIEVPCSVACTDWLPSEEPSVRVLDAKPEESVVVETGVVDPPPLETNQEICAPGTAFP